MAGRIEDGRRRAHAAKRALAAASVAAFVALLSLARESHAGHASSVSRQSATAAATQSGDFFQPTTVTPSSGSGADVQTHAS
jgi:hypothetical protein